MALWTITPQGALSGRALPWRCLAQSIDLFWNGDGEVELYSLEYHATTPDIHGGHWSSTYAALGPVTLTSTGGRTHASLAFPFQERFIHAHA